LEPGGLFRSHQALFLTFPLIASSVPLSIDTFLGHETRVNNAEKTPKKREEHMKMGQGVFKK
jgi:hypothetical protein